MTSTPPPTTPGPDRLEAPSTRSVQVPPTAAVGRRLLGLVVDWMACLAISAAFAPTASGLWLTRGSPWVTLMVFALENLLLVGLTGNTLGQRLVGIRVRPVVRDGVPGLATAAVRIFLLCLVIPAAVWMADGRGLHDVAAGTVIVRRAASARR